MQAPEESFYAAFAGMHDEECFRCDEGCCCTCWVSGCEPAVTDLIRERDAEVRADERAKVLAGFTEERADRMVARRVPCDCPGDWQHHGRFVGDDGPETHVSFEAVPSRRLVSPWEPTP